MEPLAQLAIQAALDGRWKEATQLNRKILKETPKDTEALNRLARAFLELGKVKRTITTYKKVLRLDHYNSIAQKALEKLGEAKDGLTQTTQTSYANSIDFLEEPGKTKTVSLIHLGSSLVIASLDVADKVTLSPHAHRVSVETESGKFIGRLPDDLSRRLIKLVRIGNRYEAYVRSVNKDCVRVFIREIERGKEVGDIPSFPGTDKTNYVSFTHPDSVHKEKPDITDWEEKELL